MIGLDLLGAATPPAPPAPPANLIDTSQNIYATNPVVPTPGAPAPTSATSYYPEAPGFVEDPRKLDINRDFGMQAYVPQWDTPEQAMLGIDLIGAAIPRWDEVRNPTRVVLSPRGGGSTVFGDPLSGVPSGVARVTITGGTYWKPSFQANASNWDDSKGSAPMVVVYFTNGSSRTFAGLQSVSVVGGALRRGAGPSWWSRWFKPRIGDAGGPSAADIRAVQTALKAAGFDPGMADGKAGTKTVSAIEAFWASRGLSHAPSVDADLMEALGVGRAALPADGRPAKGWSQPMPEAMGPAITPDTPAPAGPCVRCWVIGGGIVAAVIGAVAVVIARRRG